MTAWECAQTGWGKRGILTHPTPISDLTPAVRVGTPNASLFLTVRPTATVACVSSISRFSTPYDSGLTLDTPSTC